MRKTLKKVFASATAALLALTAIVGVSDTKAQAAEFDPAGSYFATVGFQQSTTWIFHDECTSETLGLTGTELNGLNYETDVMQSGDDGTVKVDGEVKSVELKGNGTYTVSITGLNGILTADQTAEMTMIYLSTNLPADAKDKVTFSDVTLKLDNKTVTLPEKQFFKPETLEAGYTSLYLYDTYARDQGEYAECPSIVTPNDSIEITFTVAGFANDNPDAVAPAEDEATSDDAAASSSSSEAEDSDSSGSFPVVPIVVVAVVVVVVIVVVVVTRKKK